MAPTEELAVETPQKEQDWTKSCPICFVENVPLVKSESCGHSFCQECLEQFFQLPPDSTQQESTNGSPAIPSYSLNVEELRGASIEGIATLGRCPLCRSPISLLEMNTQVDSTRLPLWSCGRMVDFLGSPLAGKVYATRRGIGCNSFHFPPFLVGNDGQENDGQTLPYLLWQEDNALYPNKNDTQMEETVNHDSSTPIKYYFDPGCFYFAPKQTFHGRIKLPDAHGNSQPNDVLLCFANNHKWITGGFMLRHYHNSDDESSNTQVGASQQYYPLEGKWKVTWYREKLAKDADLEDDTLADLVVDTAHVSVIRNTVHDETPIHYMLRYEKEHICFHWPGMKVTQTLKRECDFRKSPPSEDGTSNCIPAIGDYLKWTTTDPQQPYIVWQRETIGDSTSTPFTAIDFYGRSSGDSMLRYDMHPIFARMRNDQTWYREWRPAEVTAGRLRNSDSESDGRPRYHKDQLWGNVFCQALRVGLASYHFGARHTTNTNNGDGEHITEEQPVAYISYEHADCSRWPPLDDGSPIPPQVYFHDISIETVEETRPNPAMPNDDTEEDTTSGNGIITTSHIVFRGNIEWLQDYGTTWQNCERWEYEMHFDSQLTCIISGTVHSIKASPTSPSSREEMSQYGTELIYLNAGIFQAFERWMNPSTEADEVSSSDISDGVSLGVVLEPEGAGEQYPLNSPRGLAPERYQRYTELSRRLRRRLQTEGASVRTTAVMNQVLTVSQQPGGMSPFDYNLIY